MGLVGFYDDYLKVGAKIIKAPEEIFKKAELIVKVKEPQMSEVKMIKEGQIITEKFIDEALSIPCSPWLNEEEQNFIIDKLIKVANGQIYSN